MKYQFYNLRGLERVRFEWSLKTFDTTPLGSLAKLREETDELEKDLLAGVNPAAECVDVLMCAFDIAQRAGVSFEDLVTEYARKVERNENRVWAKNENGSYSHVK